MIDLLIALVFLPGMIAGICLVGVSKVIGIQDMLLRLLTEQRAQKYRQELRVLSRKEE